MLNSFTKIFYYCIVIFVCLGTLSCASLTGFQDGRAIGESNFELAPSLNVSQSPDFIDIDDSSTNDNLDKLLFPNIELGFKYGITEQLDLTAKLNTNLNTGVGIKYQLLGDRMSKHALGVGFEIGTFGLLSGLFNFQIPLYASIHPKENFAFYVSPRYVHQISTIGDLATLNYFGGNIGILLGYKNKFGVDLGIYNISSSENYSASIFTFGVCGKFIIGDNMAGDPSISKTRKTLKQR